MTSHSFLQSVADYYCQSPHRLANLTMVFPNKRSAMFMRMYFKKRLKGVVFLPRMVSISYFTQMHAGGSQLASPIEQLFTLYDCYRRVLRRHGREEDIRDFDTFIFWGLIILRDFDDVDSYMVDAEMLFRNLRNEKEISSNYLTEAQLQVVRELWGSAPELDVDRFWRHVGVTDPAHPDSEMKSGFLSLWQIMGELYEEFTRSLASRPIPMATAGGQSRRACDRIRALGVDDFNGRRYAFVGFNVLSTARTLIFAHLQKIGVADFFWDISSPFFPAPETNISTFQESFNKAAKFIIPLSRKFPMPEGYEPPQAFEAPQIEIISSPSNIGQVKTADAILRNWHAEGLIRPDTLLSTAIVLPDAELLTPMLNSIPIEIDPINVTMGLSYSSTPLSAFLSAVFAMHLRNGNRPGHYSYDDINEVLSHPYISLIAPEEAEAVRKLMRSQRLYNVPINEILPLAPHLDFIFTPIDEQNAHGAGNFLRRLLDTLSRTLTINAPNHAHGYEIKILQAYSQAVEEICVYIDRFGVAMQKSTFLLTLERTLARLKLNFSGKPLEGLQIMGMPDTRALDFENVIVLSMNERIFPRKSLRPSFIPESLRAGYAMPTLDFEESTAAYQFYRLISRARRVRLLYDNRTQAEISGEMSRFLYQLIYMPCGASVERRGVEIEPENISDRELTVHKTPEVIAALHQFRPDAEKKRYLSASAIKTYLTCPLQFYLKYVRGLRDEDTPEAFINAALFGTILHEMARYLYSHAPGNYIDEVALNTMLGSDLHTLALRMMSQHGYSGRYNNDLSRIPGEGRVLARVIVEYVRAMLRAEKKLPPFKFVEAEMGEGVKHVWKINDRYTLNFKMSVDRVDAIDADSLRFIDYKTGKDETTSASIANLFSSSKKSGILQLLTYCEAYADIYNFSGAIYPKIYKIMEIATAGVPELKVGKLPLGDYRDHHEAFRPMLEEVIDKIFEEDDAHPFAPTTDIDKCQYCFFADMCGRNITSNN